MVGVHLYKATLTIRMPQSFAQGLPISLELIQSSHGVRASRDHSWPDYVMYFVTQ